MRKTRPKAEFAQHMRPSPVKQHSVAGTNYRRTTTTNKGSELAFRELEALASALLPVFLTFMSAGIAR